MEFYRSYNVDAAGNTIAFKGFPSDSDHNACVQALAYKAEGKWHTMELWTGCDSVDCSALSNRGLGRRVSLPSVS